MFDFDHIFVGMLLAGFAALVTLIVAAIRYRKQRAAYDERYYNDWDRKGDNPEEGVA